LFLFKKNILFLNSGEIFGRLTWLRMAPWCETVWRLIRAPMKLVCSQAELSASLQLVSRAVASRPTHPVLANVLLTADAATNRISLTGFDLHLGIQTTVPASVETSGAVTLPARLFGDIISRLSSDSPITLSCEEGQEQVDLTSLSGSYQMRGMSADDFPDLPLVQTGTPIQLDPGSLVQGLRATLFASSGDESKQLLTGVHLSLDGEGLECAATDGHRLAVLRLPHLTSDADEGVAGEPFSVTVPARSLRELERLLSGRPSADPLSLFCDRGQVVLLWADQVLTSRSLEGTYPNYRQLIPASFSRTITLDRRAFTSSLERVAVLADQHNNVVKMALDPARGLLTISVDAQDVGSGSEQLPAEMEGEPIEIAFNVRYLLEGLKVIGTDRVRLQCNAPTTPAVLSPAGEESDYTYLVMPVQIRT
jgi:DNA polymerase-3 subunit beta